MHIWTFPVHVWVLPVYMDTSHECVNTSVYVDISSAYIDISSKYMKALPMWTHKLHREMILQTTKQNGRAQLSLGSTTPQFAEASTNDLRE